MIEKQIRFSRHALDRLADRGATEEEVRQAVREGAREPAKLGRHLCRLNLQFDSTWQGKEYEIKQVAPVVAETPDEIIVVTVYTFYY
jgi:DNA topoisomerase VI subunit B